MNSISNPKGITVKELRDLIADWPELDEDGEPTEVWVETGPMLSSPCMEVVTLNDRKLQNGQRTAALLLCPSGDAWP